MADPVCPATVTFAVALTVIVPTTFEFTTTVHWPLASVTVVVHVPPVMLPTPVDDVLTVTPAAGPKVPVPGSFSTVTVNVWALPTSFVSFVWMLIRASTYVLFAEPDEPWVPSVFRVNDRPPV